MEEKIIMFENKKKIEKKGKISPKRTNVYGIEIIHMPIISYEQQEAIATTILKMINSIQTYAELEVIFKKLVLDLVSDLDTEELLMDDLCSDEEINKIFENISNYKDSYLNVALSLQAKTIEAGLFNKISIDKTLKNFKAMLEDLDKGKLKKLEEVILTNSMTDVLTK